MKRNQAGKHAMSGRMYKLLTHLSGSSILKNNRKLLVDIKMIFFKDWSFYNEYLRHHSNVHLKWHKSKLSIQSLKILDSNCLADQPARNRQIRHEKMEHKKCDPSRKKTRMFIVQCVNSQ